MIDIQMAYYIIKDPIKIYYFLNIYIYTRIMLKFPYSRIEYFKCNRQRETLFVFLSTSKNNYWNHKISWSNY